MKNELCKIGAFSMAFLVLFSSTSFLISTHFCAGKVANVSYFVPSDACSMNMEQSCENKQTSERYKKSCCKSAFEIIDAADFLNLENPLLHKELFQLALQNWTLFFLESNVELEFSSWEYYTPPIACKNLNLFYETFLI
jgi:hypothetical protein